MFNLLPEDLRSLVKSEYRLRLIIVILFFVIFTQLSLIIFLAPAWLSSYYREKEYLGRGEEMDKFLSSLDISSTTSSIKSINSKLNIINNSLEYQAFVPIMESIISQKTSSIKLNEVTYTVNSATSGTVSLKGTSDTRESLVAFGKSLGSVSYFKKVDLPISNLAKDRNIDFSISLTVEK